MLAILSSSLGFVIAKDKILSLDYLNYQVEILTADFELSFNNGVIVLVTGILTGKVIVFDMPNSIKEYIHQIGRASRLGDEGTAIVFLNEENKNMFLELIEILKSSGAIRDPFKLVAH
uniref:Helicase C-terminal domain-containing protein n=1 Tax=Quercus lobata TaxID=97700 RepID=A0A7N2RBR1_QUELO